MTRAPERILGFDARVRGGPAWDRGRREGYLYRLDVARPRSIDRTVWPSVFDARPGLRPGWVGRFDELWEDLEALAAHLRAARPPVGGYDLVAFGVAADLTAPGERTALEDRLRGVHPDGTPGPPAAAVARPAEVEPGWELLGYDVADLGCVGGLANLGFDPGREDVAGLRARWAPRLNALHLFDHRRDAAEFREFVARRAPEHAPFYVYPIWRPAAGGG